jgi:hypothetical protein
MSKPFGSMPADQEMVAIGCGLGGLMRGLITPDVMFLAMGRTVSVDFSPMPWWFAAFFAAAALSIVLQITGKALRVALTAFAVGRLMSIGFVGKALSINAIAVSAVNGVFACGLIIATWPRAGRLTKAVTIVLFASALAVRMWVRSRSSSVFGYFLF